MMRPGSTACPGHTRACRGASALQYGVHPAEVGQDRHLESLQTLCRPCVIVLGALHQVGEVGRVTMAAPPR